MYEPSPRPCNNLAMSCSSIILCGGRGARVGGADKGLLDYCGQPFVQHVISRLSEQVDEILISANRNLEQYRGFGSAVVSDELDDYQGPLAGIAAALPQCRFPRVIIAACDMPRLPMNLAPRLLAALEGHDVSYAWDGGRDQYLVAALRRELGPELRAYLAAGNRSVHGWYETLRCERVDFSDHADAFANLNRLANGLGARAEGNQA